VLGINHNGMTIEFKCPELDYDTTGRLVQEIRKGLLKIQHKEHE
jgi:hypothetical protein